MANGIPYGEALIQALEKSLRSAFRQPFLRLTRKPAKPGEGFAVSLEAGDKVAQTDEGRELVVLNIVISEDKPTAFYFGFVGSFEISASRYLLQHASISVFHDILAGDLAPLFRAEWDQKAATDATSEHAQPHWHFVQSPERIGGFVRTLIKPTTEFSPGMDNELFAGIADCGKFHFAMTSLLGQGPMHKELFLDSDFPKWFANLAKYVGEQIAYVVSKAPAAPVVEFIPADN